MVYNSVKYVQIGKKIDLFISAHLIILENFTTKLFYGTADI